MKATTHSDMSVQTAVQHFLLKKENAIAVEKYAVADAAHLNNTKLESGQEDADFILIVQVSNHAVTLTVNIVKDASDLGQAEMIFGVTAALDD